MDGPFTGGSKNLSTPLLGGLSKLLSSSVFSTLISVTVGFELLSNDKSSFFWSRLDYFNSLAGITEVFLGELTIYLIERD